MGVRFLMKSYNKLIKIKSYQKRFEYLKLDANVGDATFGGHRVLNQILYHSNEWKQLRHYIIVRDNGCDLAHDDYPIAGKIYIHHLNPITIDDVLERKSNVLDPNNLVCVSFDTHNALHYGNIVFIRDTVIERRPGDTDPWFHPFA